MDITKLLNNDDVYADKRAVVAEKENSWDSLLAGRTEENDYNVVEESPEEEAAPAAAENQDIIEPRPLNPDTLEPEPQPNAPEIAQPESVESLFAGRVAEAKEVTATEPKKGVNNGRFSGIANELSEEGKAELNKREDGPGLGVLDAISWFGRPFTALTSAGLAPIAGEAKSVGEAFSMSKEAFLAAVHPTYGEGIPYHAKEIVEREFPGLPPVVREVMSAGLDLISDPTTVVTLRLSKVVQAGMQAKKMQELAEGAVASNKGIFEEGVYKLLGVDAGFDPNKLSEVGHVAARADRGDKKAFAKLNAILKDGPIDAEVKRIERNALVDKLEGFKKAFGDASAPMAMFDEAKLRRQLKKDGYLDDDAFSYAANINLAKYDIDEGAKALLQQGSEFFHNAFAKSRNSKTMKQLDEAAENLELRDLIGRPVTHHGAVEAKAIRSVLVSTANLAKDKLAKAKSSGTGIDLAAAHKAFYLNLAVQQQVTGVASEAGRTLNVFKQQAKSTKAFDQQLHSLMGSVELDKEFMGIMKALDLDTLDASQFTKFAGSATRAFRTRAYDGLHELYVNSILSGPLTHAVNVTSTASMTALRPTEAYLAAVHPAVRGDFAQAGRKVKEANALAAGLVGGVSDVLRVAFKRANKASIKYPEELEHMHELAKQKVQPAITGANFNATGALGKMVDYFGATVRMPGNALLKEDKAFKLINYRMSVNHEAVQRAQSLGKNADDVNAIYRAYRNSPDQAMKESAMKASALYTFTNKLEGRLMDAEKFTRTPGLNLLIPFFRTPVNIVKFGMRNSIIGNLRYDLMPAIRGGPGSEVAKAKVAIGSLIPATIAMAMGDNITGHVNERTRTGRFNSEFGAPPYSIRVDGKWHSYAKIEPVRSLLGLVVSYRDAINHIDMDAEGGMEIAEEVAGVTMMPFIDVMSENAMLDVFGHIHYLIEGALSGSMKTFGNQMEKMAAAMAVPNFIYQMNSLEVDPIVRNANTLLEKIQKRIPGLSDELPARHNAFGEPQYVPRGVMLPLINPFLMRPDKNDPVANKMIEIEAVIPNIEPKEITMYTIPIKLTTQQSSMMGELIGQGIKEGNKLGLPALSPMREVIGSMMKMERFQKASVETQAQQVELQYNTRKKQIKQLMFRIDPSLMDTLNEGIAAKKKLDNQ